MGRGIKNVIPGGVAVFTGAAIALKGVPQAQIVAYLMDQRSALIKAALAVVTTTRGAV